LDDPSKAPSFQSVVLDQIQHLRKQLDEDEQVAMMAESRRVSSGGGSQSGSYGGEGMNEENYRGRGSRYSRYSNGVLGGDGLPQFVAQGDREDSPPLIIQM